MTKAKSVVPIEEVGRLEPVALALKCQNDNRLAITRETLNHYTRGTA